MIFPWSVESVGFTVRQSLAKLNLAIRSYAIGVFIWCFLVGSDACARQEEGRSHGGIANSSKAVRRGDEYTYAYVSTHLSTQLLISFVPHICVRVFIFGFEQVGEEYLILLPECLPFLSELLEDDFEDVATLAGEVVRFVEELSGEELDAYLQ